MDKSTLTLMPKTIVPIWSDENDIIVRDRDLQDGLWISTSHLVYAPRGAKVEIIHNIETVTAVVNTNTNREAKSVAN